jgi:hypothetical protein
VTGAAGIVAGVDVGNTTTEIVIAAHDGDRWAVVAFDPGLPGRLCVPGADGHLVPFSDNLSPQDIDAAPAPSAHHCTSDHVY